MKRATPWITWTNERQPTLETVLKYSREPGPPADSETVAGRGERWVPRGQEAWSAGGGGPGLELPLLGRGAGCSETRRGASQTVPFRNLGIH